MEEQKPQGLPQELYEKLLHTREAMLDIQKRIQVLQTAQQPADAERLLNAEINLASCFRTLEQYRQEYEELMQQYLDARG